MSEQIKENALRMIAQSHRTLATEFEAVEGHSATEYRKCTAPTPEFRAWLETQISELRNALKESNQILKEFIDDIGGCDHSVGICCCGIISQMDRNADLIDPLAVRPQDDYI